MFMSLFSGSWGVSFSNHISFFAFNRLKHGCHSVVSLIEMPYLMDLSCNNISQVFLMKNSFNNVKL